MAIPVPWRRDGASADGRASSRRHHADHCWSRTSTFAQSAGKFPTTVGISRYTYYLAQVTLPDAISAYDTFPLVYDNAYVIVAHVLSYASTDPINILPRHDSARPPAVASSGCQTSATQRPADHCDASQCGVPLPKDPHSCREGSGGTGT